MSLAQFSQNEKANTKCVVVFSFAAKGKATKEVALLKRRRICSNHVGHVTAESAVAFRRDKAEVTLAGLGPAIFGSEGQRLIH